MSKPSSPPLPLLAIFFLTVPPLMWAGNAVLGRALSPVIPPVTLNLIRWALALLLLLPWTWRIFLPNSPLWAHWKRYAILGLLGISCYNTFQYMGLHTSTPVNITLVGASSPFWMMLVGRLFFGHTMTVRKLIGACLSIFGVAFVLTRGSVENLLSFQLVIGDLHMLIATVCWSFYSWILMGTQEPAAIRQDWKAMLAAQLFFGVLWSIAFTAFEWALQPGLSIDWSNPTLQWGIVYVVLGPALLSYAFWGLGMRMVGPTLAGFFPNLTPLFAAILSALLLGEMPAWYHGVAFLCIVGGIVISARGK